MTSDLRLLHWPEEDHANFTQFTAIMAEVQTRIQAISGEAGGVPVPRPPRVPTPRECAAMILRRRRDIRAMAGPDADLFSDPAWEIMLAVFVADEPQSDATLFDAAGMPGDSVAGAESIALLIARDWIERTGAGHLRATEKSRAILEQYFQRL
ncbi:hypothetical protein [Sphingomonas sp. GM_Shp_1]|uniref:hypothetical protein n=1 Tax=Sphingomonas sp. GM_Shp_1 TaxID=2937381 RepID=UPI00226B32BC|nr:hypothetical protein [Sphingomonas sp. GM_Shp_1]